MRTLLKSITQSNHKTQHLGSKLSIKVTLMNVDHSFKRRNSDNTNNLC